MDDALDLVLGKLDGVQGRGGGAWMARCPAHEDSKASLSVGRGTEQPVVLKCHAGCELDDILAKLGLTPEDISAPRQAREERDPVVATYQYTDESGDLLFEVQRTATKRFMQRRPDGRGGWAWKLGSIRRVPYRLPRVIAAVAAGQTVYVVEGEKDVHAIEKAGGVATCNPMGAGKWRSEYDAHFAGATVVIVADRDEPGRKHAADVAKHLRQVAKSVTVTEPAEGKDAYDHLASGLSLAEFQAEEDEQQARASLLVPGGTFILDTSDSPEPVWGKGDEVLWAQGEALMICGPSGVGKTTIAAQLVKARLGLSDGLLGMPVQLCARNVLYLAMDRPAQAARLMKRIFGEDDRTILDGCLLFWKGPPYQDLARNTNALLELCLQADADTVIIDSLKDGVVKLSDDEAGGGYNIARQKACAAGIQVLELHHQRKATGDNKRPRSLDDVYGSVWLTAGAGSVVVLWGKPGDPVIEFGHLKQPASEVGPWQIIHDHETGTTSLVDAVDVLAVVGYQGSIGMNPRLLATMLFTTDDPDRNQIEKARNRLNKLVADGHLTRVDGSRGGGKDRNPSTYFLAERRFG